MSRANGAPCFAVLATLVPALVVLVAAVRVALPALESDPVVDAIAGAAEIPAATAASAAPAVTVASREVLLADPTDSRRCALTELNGGNLTCESNVSLSAGRGGHALWGTQGSAGRWRYTGLRLGGTRMCHGSGRHVASGATIISRLGAIGY